MTKLQILEKQNKDYKIRLENNAVKQEIDRAKWLEECNKLEASLKAKDSVITMLQKEIMTLTESERSLKEENKLLKETLEKAEDLAAQYRAMMQKDSKTSSKPPTTDGYKKPKIYNSRKKSVKKPGGQFGHVGHTLNPYENPTNIVKKNPPLKCECGGEINTTDTYTAKQQVDVIVMPIITEERVYTGNCTVCGRKHRGEYSEGYVNPVQYGVGLKAMVASLNAHANVTVNKTAAFLNSVTNGLLNISDGTVVNIMHELSSGLGETIDAIKAGLIAGKILNADETGCRVNGGLDWIQIFCNELYTLFSRNTKRGSLCVENEDILLLFTGILVHDHFKSYYNYEHMTHAECNAHILRYLEAVIKIQEHRWAKEMSEFLRLTLHQKKERLAAGIPSFSEDELQEIRVRYLEILKDGQSEYDAAVAGKKNIKYYDEERCLLKRLLEYADQHLLFVNDFDVPFDNNNAEHGARFMKSKLKSAGCFRSEQGADDYARVASLIATLRKQNQNIFSTIRDIFNGIQPAFVSATSLGG